MAVTPPSVTCMDHGLHEGEHPGPSLALRLEPYDRATLVYDSRDRCSRWDPRLRHRPPSAFTQDDGRSFGPGRCWLAIAGGDAPSQRWARLALVARADEGARWARWAEGPAVASAG
jgi:hypothetical protein